MLESARSRWLILLVITLIVRGTVVCVMFNKLADDPDGYRQLAENLAREGIYGYGQAGDNIRPTAYRPVLYPLLLSTATDSNWQLNLWRVAALHVALGMATVWLTFDLGERLKLGSWSYFAAFLVGCDPILLNQSALVMTETLATFLAVLSLWCLTRLTLFPEWWNALMAGGALGLAALCRPTFLPWIGLVVIALLFRANGNWSRRASYSVVLVVGACVFLLPWGIRNRIEIGEFKLTTTHGGYTFLLGNNKAFFELLRSGGRMEEYTVLEVPRSGLFDRLWYFDPHSGPGRGWAMSGGEDEERDYSYAWDAIRQQPLLFAYACLNRVYQLFNPLPHPPARIQGEETSARKVLRYVTAAWYVSIYVLAILGCLRLRKEFRTPPWLWGVLLIFTFIAVHTFYWTNIRMRAPLMPFIALVAAAGGLHFAEPLARARLLRRKNLRAC